MEDRSIAVVIPYFGKLPSWFNLFLLSASKTQKIDFILFTDDITYFDYPANFKVHILSFQEFQQIFYDKLGNIYLGYPYKICEYKPCYGYVLGKYLSEYKFWGHCDIDLIFGDIDRYLDKIPLDDYDRVFTYGHLSIYRNNEKVNSAFKLELGAEFPKIMRFSAVSQMTYICNFDEVGINVIMKEFGFKIFDKSFFGNVNENFKKYRINSGVYDYPTILIYDGNKIFELKKKELEVEHNELIYIHFQNRKKINIDTSISNDFILSDEGFVRYDSNCLEEYFDTLGQKESDEDQKEYYKNLLFNRRKKTVSQLIREMKYSKIAFVSQLLILIHASRWLAKNNIR